MCRIDRGHIYIFTYITLCICLPPLNPSSVVYKYARSVNVGMKYCVVYKPKQVITVSPLTECKACTAK